MSGPQHQEAAILRRAHFVLALPLIVACATAASSSSSSSTPGDAQGPSADSSSATPGEGPASVDPFAAQPDVGEGLVDISASLDEVLENGKLAGACDEWSAEPANRKKKLLCGKSMFFDESFDTTGIPAVLFDFFASKLPDELGRGYEKLGMIPDPRSAEGRPIGTPSGAAIGNVATVAFGCASCHFGKLPDGRYSVGAANHEYEYGKHILNVVLAPQSVNPTGWKESEHHPDALAATAAVRTKLANDSGLRWQLTSALLPLLGSLGNSAVGLDKETEGHYAHWKRGTMDFLIAPLPADDKVHTISKISPLWGIPTPEEEKQRGMPHAMLGWTGGTRSVISFLEGFVTAGGGDKAKWPRERLEPLAVYLESLRAPPPPAPSGDLARGKKLFESVGCVTCHAGPRGGGQKVYRFEDVGTDDAMRWWADPNHEGKICCGLDEADKAAPLTQGIKSPRLVGLWAMSRFLHNGSVGSLEALFCIEPRSGGGELAYSDKGHEFGCDLALDDRRALIAFLKMH